MPIERKVYRVYVLKIKLFSNCSTNRALLTASSHLPKKSGSTDPAHRKRADQWTQLIRKERFSGPRSSEESGSVDPAHQKRAGQWTPLIRKERVVGKMSPLIGQKERRAVIDLTTTRTVARCFRA